LLLYQDNPQLIFESKSSTGKELSQADLIRNCPLRLNVGLGQLEEWNETTVQGACRAACRPGARRVVRTIREVFVAFRKEVIALDPCVSEEFMKRYVAYKAESNLWTSCRRRSACA
jgi:hypothetical protein